MPSEVEPAVESDIFERQRLASLYLAAPQLKGYEIVSFEGEGTYGDVWKARQLDSQVIVAIKRFRNKPSDQSRDEVEMLAKLDQARGIVDIKKVHLEEEPYCYVMEYMTGGTLRKQMELRGKLPFAEAWHIFREMIEALCYVHKEGAVHCDIKPENVLLDSRGRPRLSDFGQARSLGPFGASLGTLFYMPPEQARLERPDPQTDVYAAGAVLYEMLTGERPRYDGPLAKELSGKTHTSKEVRDRLKRYARHLQAAKTPLSHRRVRGVDRFAARLIERCLTIDYDRRPRDAMAVLNLIEQRESARRRRPLLFFGALAPAAMLLLAGMLVLVFGRLALNGFEAAWKQQIVLDNQIIADAVGYSMRERFDGAMKIVANEARSSGWVETLQAVQAEEITEKLPRELIRNFSSTTPAGGDSTAWEVFTKAKQQTETTYKNCKLHNICRWMIANADGAYVYICGDFGDGSLGGDWSTFGKDYSWRAWFNAREDLAENKQEPSQESAQKAREYLSARQHNHRPTVYLTPPYQRKSKLDEKRLWTLTLSSVVAPDAGSPVGVLCGQIDYQDFNVSIHNFEEASAAENLQSPRVVIVADEHGHVMYHPALVAETSPASEATVPQINLKDYPFFGQAFTKDWLQIRHIDTTAHQDPWYKTENPPQYLIGRALTQLENGQKLAVFVLQKQDEALEGYQRTQGRAMVMGIALLLVGVVFLGANGWGLYRTFGKLRTEEGPQR